MKLFTRNYIGIKILFSITTKYIVTTIISQIYPNKQFNKNS